MDTSNKLILVTGAGGTQGEAVALKLLEAGFKVRALVFKSEAKKLEDAGAEIVRGNFDDLESLVKAMEGAYGVFTMQNVDFAGADGETRQAKNLADAALKTGVKQVVHTSVQQAGNHEKFPDWGTGRSNEKYWIEKNNATQAVINAGFDYWTVLKPSSFMENFLQPKVSFMHPFLKQGEFLSAFRPETKLKFIAAEDIGNFATAAFKDPQGFNRKSIELTSEALTMTEVADTLSKVLGKKIKAVHVSIEEAIAKGLHPALAGNAGWYEWDSETNLDIGAIKEYKVPLTSFEKWAEKHKDEFVVEV